MAKMYSISTSDTFWKYMEIACLTFIPLMLDGSNRCHTHFLLKFIVIGVPASKQADQR